jgi:sporulation protein YlmC with PRC-barrel domain
MRSSTIAVLAAIAVSGVAHAQSTPPASSETQFITISNNALLISRLIGLNVQSTNGDSMGKIEDVAFEGGQLIGVVLSVRGISGAQRYVAVDPSSISIRYTESEDRWKATMNAKLDQLKSAPEFHYEGKWKR